MSGGIGTMAEQGLFMLVVEAMGYVPKCLVTYLKMVGFEGKDIKPLICRMQVKSISGSVKICKAFLNFNDFKK